MIFTGVVHLEYLQFYVSVVVVRRFSGGVGTSAVQWFVATSTYISVVVLVHLHFSGCVGTYIYILGAKSWRLATTALCSESFCTGGTVPLPLSYHSYQILIMHILGWYYLDQQ